MKISKETLSILKAFSSINPVMYLGDPEAIKVISSENIIGVFKCDETFDHECVFWEWPTLLSTIDSMGAEEAELDFQENFVKITSPDKSSIKYFYTPEIVIAERNPKPKPYASYAKEVESDFDFELSTEMLSKIMKISRTMGLNKLQIEMKDGAGTLSLIEDSGKVSHSYTQDIEGTGTGKINIYISTLNIIMGNYHIHARTNLFAKFSNKDIPLFMIIAASKA